ncbi:MAG TPA: OmpA family protein [Candidatus Kapabacteria bacterium]|nr:OmpA family protein [Candidatus Kapabacteria bacterium]
MSLELRIQKKTYSGPVSIASTISILILFLILSPTAYSQNENTSKPKRNKISLGRLINSPYSELSPIISPNGKYLFFTMGRDNPLNIGDEHLQDCYVSKLLPSKVWSAPKNLGSPINSKGNDAISGVSPDGRTLFVKNFNYNQTSGLCFARLDTNNRWNISPITIQDYSNSNKLSSQCISVNGDYIIVSIEKPDGFGKLDLYVSKVVDRAKNIYGPLQNLLIVINTKEDEFAPFLAADGKTLYFSSRGRGGYGEADVFMAKRLDDTWINWTSPKNLGSDINTPGMDAYYSIPASGTEAYFSSSNGANHLDLYKIPLFEEERPDPVMLLQGEVMNRSGDMIHAQIVATDLEDNLEISRSESSEGLGQFSLVLSTGNKYRLSISATGYLPFSSEIDLTQFTKFADTSITIVLDSIAIGSVATIEDIFFDFNQSTLKSESYYSLDKLAQLLASNPRWVVSIEGYTDSIGSDELNKKLSLERAQAVVTYLIGKGIAERRLQSEGFGAANPVADNATEEGRRKNRRVEFRIIKFTEQ